MNKIDLSFTKKELISLIKLLYSGYFICDNEDTTEEENNEMQDILDKFMQILCNYKLMDGIEYDNESNRYFFTAEKEEEILESYQETLEESFWDELTYRLGKRDFINEIGENEYNNMDQELRMEKEDKHIDVYVKEVIRNGIENLTILKK